MPWEIDHCTHRRVQESDDPVKRFLRWWFLGLLFLSVFLPFGKVFSVDVKLLAFLVVIPIFFYYLFLNSQVILSVDLLFLGLVSSFLLVWTLIGLLHGQAKSDQVFTELRFLSAGIFIGWFGWFTIHRDIVKSSQVISTVICAIFCWAALKLALIGVSVRYGMSLVSFINRVFGSVSPTWGDIGIGIARMQAPPDIVAPFALFALLSPELSGVRLVWPVTFLISIVLAFCEVITFSRYQWFAFMAALSVALIMRRQWWVLAAVVGLAAAVIMVYGSEYFQQVFYARFFAEGVRVSDEIRSKQIDLLVEDVQYAPFFGKGLGGYDPRMIRDPSIPFSYEVQWLMLLMQLGLVGLIGIVMLLWAACGDLRRYRGREKKWVEIIFLIWLGASFTNDYLIGSQGGAVFVLFMAIFRRMSGRMHRLVSNEGST